MSTTLFLSGIAASVGPRPLFSDLDLTLAPGDVVGLVGPNGAGKTTLLRIIAGEHPADAGSIRLAPPEATIGYLRQSPPAPAESIAAYAARRTGVGPAYAAFQDATIAMPDGRPGADDVYAAALERWLALGGADLDVRLAEVIAHLGLDADLDRPLGHLSGGQAARAALATILVTRTDVTLLDEPTNNLDGPGVDALTAYVRSRTSPVLIASHDRAFLDDVATGILELDPVQQTVARYAGGWSAYREAKAIDRGHAAEAHEAYLAQRDALVARARRQSDWAATGRAKAARLGPHQQLAKKFKGDKARRMDQRAARARAAAERIEEVPALRSEWELRYTIASAPPSAEVVLTLDGIVAGAGEFTVGPVSAQVARGDRIALAGPNGTGKTTLLDVLLGRRPPVAGRVSWGTRVSIGVVDQARTVVAGPAALSDTVMALLGTTDPAQTRTLLAKFGLGAEHVARPCDTLSEGERTRAALAVLQGRAVNVLLLDEPTNHLDAPAIGQLEAALGAFPGTVLLVTHDRALADALSPTATWVFTRAGTTAQVSVS
ncbi:ABC-F family ATP-binding cassette domain-containing protein [Propionicicella superfundia]|uniref:ABC-F family ATP-binding cassette domain-containing protein n=1 Tax=Propionicicella superfundia TaxID=348582 RepID=UPI00040CBCCE|nr:ABC-F family ATP-binding cassette domain-containing protein [Propionicicella superfundia]